MGPVYAVKRPKPTVYQSAGRLVPRGEKQRPASRPVTPSGRPAPGAPTMAARPSPRPHAQAAAAGGATAAGPAAAFARPTASQTERMFPVRPSRPATFPRPVGGSIGQPVRRHAPIGARPDLPWFPTAAFVRREHGSAQRAQVRGLWRTFVFTFCLGGAVTASHLAYYL